MPISDYLADAILNDTWRTTAFTPPGTVYIGLCSADMGRTYDAAKELANAGGYGRVGITKGNAAWSAPATVGGKREITNAAVVNFGTASAGWNGGAAIAFWFMSDSPTIGQGNLLGSGVIDVGKIVDMGDPVSFPVGTLRLRF